MRIPFSLIPILSLVIMVCLSCEPHEEEMPSDINNFPVAGVKRRIPGTPVPSFQFYCRPRPKTANDPAFVIVRNGKEPIVSSDLSDINMVNVAKIHVLKDEAAVERFGEKGRKGLIIITMK